VVLCAKPLQPRPPILCVASFTQRLMVAPATTAQLQSVCAINNTLQAMGEMGKRPNKNYLALCDRPSSAPAPFCRVQ
jgi:hypothetical protein